MAELKRLCEPDEDGDEATTIAALTASIKAFFPHLMAPQDAVGKVEGFIKQLAADRVVVIVRGGGLCFIDFDSAGGGRLECLPRPREIDYFEKEWIISLFRRPLEEVGARRPGNPGVVSPGAPRCGTMWYEVV